MICWHLLSISDDLWENEIHLVHLKHEKEGCGWENSPNLCFIRQYILSNISVSVISGPGQFSHDVHTDPWSLLQSNYPLAFFHFHISLGTRSNCIIYCASHCWHKYFYFGNISNVLCLLWHILAILPKKMKAFTNLLSLQIGTIC